MKSNYLPCMLICASLSMIAVPQITRAAATVPITQEEIEAILERDQVEVVTSSTLPNDLKKRIGQTISSTSDAVKPIIDETIDKAEQAVATATNKISSTSDEIKNNLQNYQDQAVSDLKETFIGRVSSAISSIWKSIADWFSGFFRGKPLSGSTS